MLTSTSLMATAEPLSRSSRASTISPGWALSLFSRRCALTMPRPKQQQLVS